MKIAELLIAEQSKIADTQKSLADEIECTNKDRKEQAENDLRRHLGDLYDELMSYRQEDKSGYTIASDGRINGVTICIQSDEAQLAPLTIEWASKGIVRARVPEHSKQIEISADPLALNRAIYAAHAAYPQWKQRQDESRQKRIRELCRNWDPDYSSEILENYARLKEIDPELAERKLETWKQEVIARFGNPADYTYNVEEWLVKQRVEKVRSIDPARADQCLAHYKLSAARRQQELDAYYANHNQWLADCDTWARTETTRFWQNFEVVRVRYAPIGYTGSASEDTDAIGTVFCVGTLEQVVAVAKTPGAILNIVQWGRMTQRAIGAFLEAETVARHNEAPSTHKELSYCRQVWVENICVNIPPFVTGDPVPPPAEPEKPSNLPQRNSSDLPF